MTAQSVFGFPLVADPTMKPGTIEFRDDRGNVLGRIVNLGSSGQKKSGPEGPPGL